MGNIHLIVSNDSSYISSVAKKLVSEHVGRENAVESFDGKSSALEQIDNALRTGSLISTNRAVIINNMQSLKQDAIEAIAALLSSPPEGLLLIMTSDNPELLKQKRFEAIQSSRMVVRHIAPNLSTYALLQSYLKGHAVRISPAAMEMLVNAFEVATWGIVENELNKLSTYVGKDGTIDEAAVNDLTFNIDNSDTFGFVNDLLARRQKDALKALKSIHETGTESIMVIGALAWKLRQLLGKSSEPTLIKSLGLLYRYNLAIRKGLISNTLALDKLTIELLQQKTYSTAE